jgi:acylphosphatase
LLTGRVQGVGFRHFTRQQAGRLGVMGTVANLADGRVEIEAAAEAATLADFAARVRQGPPSGCVDRLDETEIADAGWTDFRVVFK